MPSSIESLLATGTKFWLDSIDPDLVRSNRATGATGATSNPIIVADLVATGRFDAQIERLVRQGLDDEQIAWQMTDKLVRDAQQVFLPVWEQTGGNDGYVSFEWIRFWKIRSSNLTHQAGQRICAVGAAMVGRPSEPDDQGAGHARRTGRPGRAGGGRRDGQRHVDLHRGSIGRPATPCRAGRERRKSLGGFKSVYSIFVSRLDVYTEKAVPATSPAAQGMVGILNAKRIWAENQELLGRAAHAVAAGDRLRQHGHEEAGRSALEVCRGLCRQRHPDQPAGHQRGRAAKRPHLHPPGGQASAASAVVEEIDRMVDMEQLEATLMAEGIAKFAKPQKALLALVAKKTPRNFIDDRLSGMHAFIGEPSGILKRLATSLGPGRDRLR